MRTILSIPIIAVLALVFLLGCRLYTLTTTFILTKQAIIKLATLSLSSFTVLWIAAFICIFAAWQICKAVYNYKKQYK